MPLMPLSSVGIWEMGIAPVADFADTTQYTDIFNAANHKQTTFLIVKGIGTTGTSTITVEACDDTSASNTSAVPFRYRACTTLDTWGALTDATTSGFTTTAGSNQLYEVVVDNDVLAASGYKYLRLKMVEVVNSPVLGAVLVHLGLPRYPQATQSSAIV